jgi:hypothetical protein
MICHWEEGRRKREEGRRKKEEGRGKKEEGRGKKEEGRRKKIFSILGAHCPQNLLYVVCPLRTKPD